jgi:hypothetical protein
MGAEADAVNAQFHEAYDGGRSFAALEVPVLVVLEDSVILVRHGARTESAFTPELFHIAKSVAHAPIAAFAIAHAAAEAGTLDHAGRAGLERLRQTTGHLGTSLGAFARHPDASAMSANMRQIAADTVDYLQSIRDQENVDLVALRAFARAMGPALLLCTRDATEIQLKALHREVTRVLGELDEAERRDLEVVVAGAHQARVRSLAMQYFEKLFDEVPGEERQVSYAEGVRSVEEAIALVGRRRLDRTIASSFFGDPARLQRDILGDAAKDHIAGLDVGPRG